ncbi:MAG: 4Fe-4S binding protein [Candidatus Lokiarchaeota archaeon]|nr:4Fe-4S binding protein [Candidatus Lokiarchaeota archaeon]MBD3343199.1 4Fe-4S binding protein [Candidatus Lokiarchaeota archaeon]
MSLKKTYKAESHKITTIRRIVQITAFIAINYVIIEFIFSVNLKAFEPFIKVLPVLNSPRNPLSNGAGFTEYLFYFITQGVFPFLIIAVFMFVILFTGRFFCGWICPIGTIQDGLTYVPTDKKKLKIKTNKALSNFKYMIIILLLILIVPLGITKLTDTAFYVDYKENLGDWAEKPIGFFSLSEFIFVFFPNLITAMWENIEVNVFEPLFTDFWVFFTFFFYIIVVILSLYYPRFYCRFICPFAAIAAAISDYSFLKLTRSPVRCVGRTECGICERVCPKQIRILDEPFEFFTGNGECNLCLKCMENCPYDAINIKFG